jgi:hypothetical protein
VPPDAEGDPALRLLLPALKGSPALRWGGLSVVHLGVCRPRRRLGRRAQRSRCHRSAGVQRRRAEAQWRALAEERGIASAVFRLPGLYGPGRNALLQLAQGRARHVCVPGLVFNRLHVQDLATVIIAAMQRPTLRPARPMTSRHRRRRCWPSPRSWAGLRCHLPWHGTTRR